MFISQSYDATSHFETASNDIQGLYTRLMGEPLDLSKLKSPSVNVGDEN